MSEYRLFVGRYEYEVSFVVYPQGFFFGKKITPEYLTNTAAAQVNNYAVGFAVR